jgi:hypothetical protein
MNPEDGQTPYHHSSSPQTADIHPGKGGQSRLFMLRAAKEMKM